MNLDALKITRPIDLGGYAPEYAGVVAYVWVNPPDNFLQRLLNLGRQVSQAQASDTSVRLGREIVAVLRELWSQNKDTPTHWSAEDVLKLASPGIDPKLASWLLGQSGAMIAEYKRGLQAPSPTD